jgi:hypothetical protein
MREYGTFARRSAALHAVLSPGDELRRDAEALTLATSLFPDRVNENPFFTEGPRRIFAHLLTFRPTAVDLASWLCCDEELDRQVACGRPATSQTFLSRHGPISPVAGECIHMRIVSPER